MFIVVNLFNYYCQDIATRKSHFVINPQWISEDFNKPEFKERTHRPWAYEFPGARRYDTSGSGVPIPDKTNSAAAIVSAQLEKKLPKQYVFY